MSDSEKPKRRKKGEGSVQSARKISRTSGQAYTTKTNRSVEAKNPPLENVPCKCKNACTNLSYEQRLQLFLDFYKIPNLSQQNTYLMGLILPHPIKCRRKGVDPNTSHKQTSVSFTLPNGSGDIVKVCKQVFMSTFAVTKRRIETLVNHKKMGKVTYSEKRGNKGHNKKYTDEDIQRIIGHINTIPRQESHYSRAKSGKEFLSQDLSRSRLHRAFNEIHKENKVSYRFYYETFNSKFPNLSFRTPRTDTCNTCDLLNAQSKNDPNNKAAAQKLEIHHRKAEKARKSMDEDHKNSQMPTSDACTISMDLQQVLSLPALTHSKMYYSRQLSVYNFGIHVGDNNNVYTMMWHEGITGRGGNEIASALLKAIHCQITSKRKLIIWSDNCGAQNKNQMLMFLWFYLISKGWIDEVQQKFLVSGHSFLSCDRDFAQIEKRKRKTDCQVPFDVIKVIVSARLNHPYLASMMESDEFYDFRAASKESLLTTKLQISKTSWILVSKEKPGIVMTRRTFNDIEPWSEINIFKKNVTLINIASFLRPLECISRLSADKKKDLKEMLNYLKDENKAFYQNLLQ